MKQLSDAAAGILVGLVTAIGFLWIVAVVDFIGGLLV